MKDDASSHRDIQASSLFSVLRNIDKIVTVFFVNRQYTCPLISQEEGSASSEGMFLDGQTILSNFNTTNTDSLLVEISFYLL